MRCQKVGTRREIRDGEDRVTRAEVSAEIAISVVPLPEYRVTAHFVRQAAELSGQAGYLIGQASHLTGQRGDLGVERGYLQSLLINNLLECCQVLWDACNRRSWDERQSTSGDK